MSQPGRERGHSHGFVAADLDRVQKLWEAAPSNAIMRRLHADRGDNPAPGIQCYTEKIVDE